MLLQCPCSELVGWLTVSWVLNEYTKCSVHTYLQTYLHRFLVPGLPLFSVSRAWCLVTWYWHCHWKPVNMLSMEQYRYLNWIRSAYVCLHDSNVLFDVSLDICVLPWDGRRIYWIYGLRAKLCVHIMCQRCWWLVMLIRRPFCTLHDYRKPRVACLSSFCNCTSGSHICEVTAAGWSHWCNTTKKI